ncbi:MAG: efflux RND transporter periplasmic adaptor subunit [Pseudomonadota bacterium]|nr:efflux RND transporter periplasmic adaptor subunit [Pseudomonadota bacterium]MDE3038726.1 efflux RND transporter periplasmic adaptor subunit [Pseudomonadota bacterium]
MFRRKKILIGLFAVALISMAIYLMSSTEASLPKLVAKPVAVAVVTRGNLTRDITLSGEFRPYQEADLHAKVAGYLKDITVDIGDQVKAGQVIATIDIDELKDDLDRAKAAYHDAKLDYDRVSEVIKKRPGLLAQEDVDKAQATYEMAKANMERARTFLDYATIVVPFDGIITKRYVDPGALIQSSDNSSTQTLPIVHVAENKKLRLDFPVPEPAVPHVHVGTKVKVTVPATGQTIYGTVARTAGKIDNNTRTMETEVDVDNSDLRITPGMYASVTIDLDHREGVLALPVQAVVLGDAPNVWVVNSKHEIEELPVKIGLQTADRVEIAGRLHEGTQVVFGNRDSLSIGMIVDPKPVTEKKGS